MGTSPTLERFALIAEKIGAVVAPLADAGAVAGYIANHCRGKLLLPAFASGERHQLKAALRAAGVEVVDGDLRNQAAQAAAGITGANFAIADTGTVVIDSTAEALRLASTLPERHFVLCDPSKIVADGAAAVPWLRKLRERNPRQFLAWISGPSRTADIERVLTIGVHGPKELHILLVEGWSNDFLEV